MSRFDQGIGKAPVKIGRGGKMPAGRLQTATAARESDRRASSSPFKEEDEVHLHEQ
jgi:hypothetical protein